MSRGWDEGSPALGEEPWRELRPSGDWDELVLPAELIARLREVRELYRERPLTGGHRSLLLLFGGPSGMGKTSAALALAADLGRPVLEADVEELIRQDATHAPHLVARLINHARQLGGVLVLDRADPLLRPRREASIADPNERAALPLLRLGRDESRLPGVVIFCAELVHPGEHARLEFDRTFVFPQLDAPARAQLWDRHLPAGHLIPSTEIAYLAQAFRLSGKDIAHCCALAEQRTVGRSVTLHDIADRLDAVYADRVTSDLTRAALDEVRVRAARLALAEGTPGDHIPNSVLAPTPLRRSDAARWVPADRPRMTAARPAAPAPPVARPVRRAAAIDLAPRPRRDRLTMLGVLLTGAVAAIALGIALSPHSKAQPAAISSPTVSGPNTTLVAYRSHLTQALGALNQSRTQLSQELGAAHSPAAQAKAAYALATAHLKAAAALVRLDAGSATTANQSLVTALRKAGDAYSTLASAAQKHDARSYASARTAVGRADASVSGAIIQVRIAAG